MIHVIGLPHASSRTCAGYAHVLWLHQGTVAKVWRVVNSYATVHCHASDPEGL